MECNTTVAINWDDIKSAKTIFKVLDNKTRREIIELIKSAGTICANDIHIALVLDQPTCANHLKALRSAQVVIRKRNKESGNHRNVFYSLNFTRLEQINSIADELINF